MDQRQQSEVTTSIQAAGTNASILSQEAVVEAYLMGHLTRKEALKRLGPEVVG